MNRNAGKNGNASAEAAEGQAALKLTREALRAASVGAWRWDAQRRLTVWEGAMAELFGLPPGQLPQDLAGFLERIHPDDREYAHGVMVRALKEQGEFEGQCRVLRGEGQTAWVAFKGRAMGRDGEATAVTGVCWDVTEQVSVQQTLEQERRALGQAMSADGPADQAEGESMLWMRDYATGRLLFMSRQFESLWGMSVAEVSADPMKMLARVHPEDRGRVEQAMRGAYEQAHPPEGPVEFRLLMDDGEVRWLRARTYIVSDDKGQPARVGGMMEDVTISRAAREARRKLLFIADSSSDFMTLINRDYVYEEVNRAYAEAQGLTWGDIVGKSVAGVWGEDTFENVIRHYLDRCLAGEQVHYEAWLNFTNLGRGYYDITYYPYRDGEGQVTHAVVVSHDITERRHAEEELTEALAEKDILLREVHHRVKNNMQVIISLLNLQAGRLGGGPAVEAIRDSQNRVRAMSLVHETIFRSKSLANVDMASYVATLAGTLGVAYDAARRNLTFQVDVVDVELDVDKAVPCGLVINELVTNSLKHAFPNDGPGSIVVKMRRQGDKVVLKVADDGLGLPGGGGDGERTLGLELVRGLAVNQLGGQLKVDGSSGTKFELIF